MSRTEVSSLGEFGLIHHLTEDIDQQKSTTVLGIGDDAAVIDHAHQLTVVTTDLLVENIHFDLSYTPLKHLGYKAIAVNLSDVFAMNAQPTSVTVSLAFSNRFSVEALEELYEGIKMACRRYHVDLVGGDTSTSTSGLVISVTALGAIQEEKIVQRSKAKVGDIIVVSGDLGAAYMGLQLLEREKKIFLENPGVQPELKSKPYILERILKPEPRADIITWLAEINLQPHAMIDVSDGLSSDLLHICTQSQVGCKIFEERLPIHEETREMAEEFGVPALTAALNGGEDYELLLTIGSEHKDLIEQSGYLTVIGEIMNLEKRTLIETRSGKEYPLTAQGWNAFVP